MNIIYDAILGKLRIQDENGGGGGGGTTVSKHVLDGSGTSPALPTGVTYASIRTELDGGVVVELVFNNRTYRLAEVPALQGQDGVIFVNTREANSKAIVSQIDVGEQNECTYSEHELADINLVTGTTVRRASTMPTASSGIANETYLYTGTTTANYINGHIYLCTGSAWADITPNDLILHAGTMPTAGAGLNGKMYLYTGTTTSDYTHGHFYKCISSGGSYVWQDAQVGTIPVGNCSGIRCITQGTSVKLKWQDAPDLIVDGVTISRWKKTVVVRKSGGYPTSPDDGTVIVTNSTRNQYASSAFIDTIPDSTITWYYGFFPVSVEDMVTINEANRAVTGDLTWASIQDITRSGEAAQYFSAGDTLTENIYNMGITSTSQYDIEVVGFDKMVAADVQFTRTASGDSGSAFAWTAADGWIIYTASATPGANDNAYHDAAMTQQTATIVSLNGNTLTATPKHSLSLCFKQCVDSMQVDNGEKQYAPTADTHFHPEYKLNINVGGAASATLFYQTDRTQTGYDRVWWSANGTLKLYYSAARSRWEIWSCNSGTHEITSATAQDYQTTASADPFSGTWFKSSVFAKANTYYKVVESAYTPAVEGTDYSAGDAVPANTYHELNPMYNGQRQYGYNRWRDSNIRQYLNSTGLNWFAEKHIFDNAPSYASSRGFLDRIPAAMKAVVGKTKLTTAVNTTDSCGGTDVTEDQFFLLANNEVGLGAVNGIAEGQTLNRYIGATDNDRKKTMLNGSATYWWLRSPNVGNARYVYYVSTSGSLNLNDASCGIGCAPACNII